MILYIMIGVTMGYFLSQGDKYVIAIGSTGLYSIITIVGLMSLVTGLLYSIARYTEINENYTRIWVNFFSGVYITLLAGVIKSELLRQDEIYKIGKIVFLRKFNIQERGVK